MHRAPRAWIRTLRSAFGSRARNSVVFEDTRAKIRTSGGSKHRFSFEFQASRFSTTAKMSGAGAASALYAVTTSPAQALGAMPEEAEQLKHHLKGGKGFVNPWDSFVDFTPWKFLLGMFLRKIRGETRKPDTSNPPPVVTPTFLPSRDTKKLRATWLGHACYYIEFPGGLRVLFDPVFEPCCAPIALSNLKRYTPPPCEIEELPFVDAVVISHNHYDHLSYPTIQRIHKKFPNAHFFAPLGNKKWFLDSGVTKVTELDWWHSSDVKLELTHTAGGDVLASKMSVSSSEDSSSSDPETITATIGALPCQHVSARTPFDKCRTLWASWMVESGGAKVYFAGDTGYRSVPRVQQGEDDYLDPKYAHLPHCPAFADIGKFRGPFHLGLIPIGAYEPRVIMSPMHANPRDSVNIFLDTKCRKALGMHWGTWVLTEEDVMEPPRKLEEALREKGMGEKGVFDVVHIGESAEYDVD